MKITTKGQVTIPKRLRDRYGVLIRRATSREAEIDRRLSRATGAASVPLTTDEIMRLTRGEL